MEQIINGLLRSYEKGAMSRRDLVGALAVLSASGASAWAAPAGFESAGINHVSIVVGDLQRAMEFYSRVFGFEAESRNRTADLVQMSVGKGQHLSIRRGEGRKGVDHFAIGIDRFDKDRVIADLKARGATPVESGGAGLHVVDPDGTNVQVIANTPA